MAVFRYCAKDIYSKHHFGKVEVDNYEELLNHLREEGMFLIYSKEAKDDKKKKAIKNDAASDFCRQMGTMIQSGISLISAMSIVVRREHDAKLKKHYRNVYVKLQQGFPMSTALSMQDDMFPPLMINMIKSAEASGKLDQAFLKLADQFTRDNRLNGKIKSAMTYPIILFTVTVIVMIVVFTVIMPQFFEVFHGYEMPVITKIVFGISRIMIDSWYWILIVLLSLIALVNASLKAPSIRYKWDRLKIKLPLIGHLISIIYTARFARSLSSLYTSGVSMIKSLSLARKTINNVYIESQFEQVALDVRAGQNLSVALDKVEGFDPKLSASIYIGEESGRLDTMLDSISDDFEFEAEIATDQMITILQPVLIIVLGAMIGLIIISVMLPLYSLYGSIGN
ncbi:MAG TPA: type II secretion pathway protein XcpS [Kandleria vitulina]|nr:type II secretion pathway protein XcpS [Kandleria vitulina]